jgi:DNA modification methylase
MTEVGESRLYCGDCREVMRGMESGSIDAVICDPPYPCIDREYGRWTEAEWHALMDEVVGECRRLLTPTGSAVFILQPNSEKVGRMRTWLWEFLAKWGRDWGQVQDAWWWNHGTMPTLHCSRDYGLMRPSLKAACWFGLPSCYRNQEAVLWKESDSNRAKRIAVRADDPLKYQASGHHVRNGRCSQAAAERGGTTPFNVLPMANSDSANSAGAAGHGAGTPLEVCRWWVRYITPPAGTVLDPFMGTATVGIAAAQEQRGYVGIEKQANHFEVACKRMASAEGTVGLFAP